MMASPTHSSPTGKKKTLLLAISAHCRNFANVMGDDVEAGIPEYLGFVRAE